MHRVTHRRACAMAGKTRGLRAEHLLSFRMERSEGELMGQERAARVRAEFWGSWANRGGRLRASSTQAALGPLCVTWTSAEGGPYSTRLGPYACKSLNGQIVDPKSMEANGLGATFLSKLDPRQKGRHRVQKGSPSRPSALCESRRLLAEHLLALSRTVCKTVWAVL